MTAQTMIAAFDFDHTLTDRDSLLPFFLHLRGKIQLSYHLAVLSPYFIQFVMGMSSRQEIKEKLLTRLLGGLSLKELWALGEEYAHQHLDRYLKPKAIERLMWHQAQGHRCLLVSASLDFYLKPWAKRHGFEEVLCSTLEVGQTGNVTGRLKGLNCWGPEKERRLLAYLGSKKDYQLYAYGDSRGDKEMLALADYPFYKTFA